MTDEGRKTLDVLIPVYRPEAKLGHLLHMLNRQRFRRAAFRWNVTSSPRRSLTTEEPEMRGWGFAAANTFSA